MYKKMSHDKYIVVLFTFLSQQMLSGHKKENVVKGRRLTHLNIDNFWEIKM